MNLDLDREFFLGGIQVNEEGDLDGWLDALQAAGMNTVEVTDYAHHGDWDTSNMWWDPNPHLLPEIRAAKARGMRVVLILRLALDRAFPRNRFLWHGMIMPRTDHDLRDWFSRYQTFALHWAEIAEREGIDVLVIGSELNALASTLPVDDIPALEDYFLDEEKQERRKRDVLAFEDRVDAEHLWLNGREAFDSLDGYLDARIAAEQQWAASMTVDGTARPSASEAVTAINRRRALLERHWTELIACLRGVYRGPLGYAANFDQYHLVGFWDQLDVMGVNAYFKLRDHLVPNGDSAALRDALSEGWRGILGDLAAFRELHAIEHLPVVFTEIGLTYRANSTIETWADQGFAMVRRSRDAAHDDTELIVWRSQPEDLTERALAVQALADVSHRLAFPLRGLLYWKLSSRDYHREVESFVALIGQDEEDPILPALRAVAGQDR